MNAQAIVENWRHDPVDQMRREQKRREMIARMASRRATDPRRALAYEAEALAAARLALIGYDVRETGPNERFDLLVDGHLRVEVKASTWRRQPGRTRGRFQANIHNRADLVLWLCRNGRDHWFVIPASEAGRTLTIRHPRPDLYAGKYAVYREAWANLEAML